MKLPKNFKQCSFPPSQSFEDGKEVGSHLGKRTSGVGSNYQDPAGQHNFEPSEIESEIARFLSELKESKSASGPEVGQQNAGSSFTSTLKESKVSRERESSQTPNDSEYDADTSSSSRSPSPSPKRAKKIRLGSQKNGNGLG